MTKIISNFSRIKTHY